MPKKLPVKKGLSHDSTDQERHFGAILESLDDKFKAMMEAVQPMAQMQADIKRILTWEDDVRLIPIMFEEIGLLRRDVELLKADVEILKAAVLVLDAVEKRLTVVEHNVQA